MITHFTGDYKWLSNFYPSKVRWQDHYYPSVEHAFQAAKWDGVPEEQENIRLYCTAAQAKLAGRRAPISQRWNARRDGVMMILVTRKFATHPALAAKLLATGDQEIQEGNYWNDTYWGVCKGVGLNRLGKLLMTIRTELRHSWTTA